MATRSTAQRPDDLERACHRLHRALLAGDQGQIKDLSTFLDRTWIQAQRHGDRTVLRAMAGHLPHLALSASASDLPAETAAPWYHHLMTLARLTDQALDLDTEGAVEEDLVRVEQFEHASAVLSQLGQQRVVQLNSLARALGISQESCCNHLGRMVRLGLVDRISRGVYRLSVRGEEVARLLDERREHRQRPERVRDMLVDTDYQRPTAFGEPV